MEKILLQHVGKINDTAFIAEVIEMRTEQSELELNN